jgi:hypothetical protein
MAKKEEQTKFDVALWSGVFAGPIAWLIQFQTRYSLVPWVCATQHRFVLHLVALVFLAVALAGGVLSWGNWVRSGKQWPSDTEDESAGRKQFLALLGIMMSGIFALVIIAQIIPAFLIDPCQ